MSQSVAGTSASDDFKSNPKAFLKRITEVLEALSKNEKEKGGWSDEAWKTLLAQLPRLKSKNMTEGISEYSTGTMMHMWANVEMDKPQHNVSTFSFDDGGAVRKTRSNECAERNIAERA